MNITIANFYLNNLLELKAELLDVKVMAYLKIFNGS